MQIATGYSEGKSICIKYGSVFLAGSLMGSEEIQVGCLRTLILTGGYRRENLSDSKLKAGLMSFDLSYVTPLPRYIFFPVPSFLTSALDSVESN